MSFYEDLLTGTNRHTEIPNADSVTQLFIGEELISLESQLMMYTSVESTKASNELRYMYVVHKHDIDTLGEAAEYYKDVLQVLGLTYGMSGEGFKDKAKSVLKSLEMYARKLLAMVLKWVSKFKHRNTDIEKRVKEIESGILDLRDTDEVELTKGLLTALEKLNVFRVVPVFLYTAITVSGISDSDLSTLESGYESTLAYEECEDECLIPSDIKRDFVKVIRFLKDNDMNPDVTVGDVNSFGEQKVVIEEFLDLPYRLEYNVHKPGGEKFSTPKASGTYKISELGPDFKAYFLDAFHGEDIKSLNDVIDEFYKEIKAMLTIKKDEVSGMSDEEIVKHKQQLINMSKVLMQAMLNAGKYCTTVLQVYEEFLKNVKKA